jgi:hypothetical protein
MKEITGNVWDFHEMGYPIIVTTNGNVGANRNAIMGKGIASEAKKRFPGLAMSLGRHIIEEGNIVKYFESWNLFTFPTKHNWWEKSDIALICRSAFELNNITSEWEFDRVCIVRPGCSNGQLSWEMVRRKIRTILDDRFVVVNK